MVEELENLAGANFFHSAVLLNAMAMAPFIEGPDSDNGLFYDSALFTVVANIPITTSVRDISQFIVVHKPSGDTLRIFAVHLKSSTGTANQNTRLSQAEGEGQGSVLPDDNSATDKPPPPSALW